MELVGEMYGGLVKRLQDYSRKGERRWCGWGQSHFTNVCTKAGKMTKQGRRTQYEAIICCSILALLFVTQMRSQEAARKVLKRVEAEYPSILKTRGIGGKVRLKVTVKADGAVKNIVLLGGNPALADAAEKAVRQWRFAPGEESTVTVVVIFDPNS